jgi:hypothetical protein
MVTSEGPPDGFPASVDLRLHFTRRQHSAQEASAHPLATASRQDTAGNSTWRSAARCPLGHKAETVLP